MKRKFKIKKLELNAFIELLIELYESGVDYIDLDSDNSEKGQDKLIIQTREEYMNPDWVAEHKTTKVETTKLTDDNLNELL